MSLFKSSFNCIVLIYLIFNFIYLSSAIRKFCNTENTICEEFSDQLNQEAALKINQWFLEHSPIKPIKCKGQSIVDEKFDNNTDPIFSTFPCKNLFGSELQFTFKGKVKDFKFEGPGKFKLGPNDDSNVKDVCFSAQFSSNEKIKSIVGNFKDGKPHGICKIEFNTGSIYIGKFLHGIKHGFFRYWDNNGRLRKIGYSFNNKDKIIWNISFNNDTRNLQLIGHTSPSVFIADNATRFFSGYLTQSTFVNSRYIEVKSIEISDCFLTLKWDTIEGNSFKFNPITYETYYHKGEKLQNPSCPQQNEWNNIDIKKNIDTWIETLNNVQYDGLWKIEPNPEPISDDAIKVINNIQYLGNSTFSCTIFNSEKTFEFTDHRNKIGFVYPDKTKYLHQGIANIEFKNTSSAPIFPFIDARLKTIIGYVDENGFMEGSMLFGLDDKLYVVAKVTRNVMHGPVIRLGTKPLFPKAKEYPAHHFEFREDGLGMAGNYKNGRPEGHFWFGTIGKGFMYGKIDKDGDFKGDELAYVYQDKETAIYGKFDTGFRMESGRKAEIIAEKCDQQGIKELKFGKIEGPVMFFSPGTNESYTKGPRNRDPYEEKYVRLDKSTVPNGGEGIFAIRDIPAKHLVSPYSAFMYRNEEELRIYQERYIYNTSLTKDERRWATKYSIGCGNSGAKIEIPIEMDYPGAWMPSLAAKINSDFRGRKHSVDFGRIDHPRFGLVASTVASRDLKSGEELYADYGYKESLFPYDFPWYHEAKKEYLKELEKEQKKKFKLQQKKSNSKDIKKKNKSKSTKKKSS